MPLGYDMYHVFFSGFCRDICYALALMRCDASFDVDSLADALYSVSIFVYVSHVSADAEMTSMRLSHGMQSIFLFFTVPRSKSVWGSYDWICVAWDMPFHRIRVMNFFL